MSDTIVTALTAVGKLPELFRSARADSLVKYTKVARVEPVTLVDAKAVYLPYTHDVLQTLNSIFAAYYLQAVSISVNVGKVDVIRLLDKINPNRDPMENAGMFVGDMLSEESYKHALPRLDRTYGLEAFGDDVEKHYVKGQKAGDDIGEQRFGKDTVARATEVANLSVGKLLEVEICQGEQKAVIPVSVRLIVSSIASDNLSHILSVGSKDTSVKERYHAWRSGQLTFVKDLMLCQDLIDDHRAALMNDKSGMYQQTLDRRNRNKISAILSGQPSVATASNLVVMTSETARQIESVSAGRFKDFKFRQNIFKNTYVMLMVVIDTAFEQITIYTRDMETPMIVSAKEIKSANKGSGPDVAEILKAYQLGNSPTI
jgi:hypothetical protein